MTRLADPKAPVVYSRKRAIHFLQKKLQALALIRPLARVLQLVPPLAQLLAQELIHTRCHTDL
jgi:hypothetical protein